MMPTTPATTCLDPIEAVSRTLGTGVALLFTVLSVASAAQGVPLKHLGRRPTGKGLFSWFYHFVVDGVGVVGYDPILGSLSPPLRLLAHVAACCMLSAATSWLFLLTLPNENDSLCVTFSLPLSKHDDDDTAEDAAAAVATPTIVSLVPVFAVTAFLYMAYFYYLMYVVPGVSVPGGPRPHKILRQPSWPKKDVSVPEELLLPDAAAGGWRCASAEDSHLVTAALMEGTTARLTGESFGRDLWTRQPQIEYPRRRGKKVTRLTETLIQEMASGGRTPGKFNPSVNPNSCDMPYRAQLIRDYIAAGNEPPSTKSKPKTVQEALHKAVHFYSMLQCEDGHWGGDYGGPHFLMPGLIIAWYVMGCPDAMFDEASIDLMKHYLCCHQQTDGGWGTHIESPSTMFGTTLIYVSLRLLGMDDDDPVCERGLAFIRKHGGALMTSSWAKFYLCLLGCMHWDGHNSVPPEMWLLPNWFPFHPGRMWCHARMVYLPMGYVYGSRIVYEEAETDPLILSLRKELYVQPYEDICWIKTRHLVAPMDNYSPISWYMATAQNVLARYETWSIFQPFKNWIRRYGLAFCADYMAAEDLQTNFIDIGPVNKVLNMISAYHIAGGDVNDPKVANHLARVGDYMWVAEDGMKMKGYNGSQCWDTSFAIQGIWEAGLLDEFPEMTNKVWGYLERCQILSTEVSQATEAYKYESQQYRRKYYRHISEGGWPFSTSAHGWPISDCTGEGLKGVLCLLKSKTVKENLKNGTLKPIDERRLEKACNILLSYQNEDGGFPTYENNRGFAWYEDLNPSEVFGDIMIDYSYVECSMASLTALVEFHKAFPDHRTAEIRHAIDKGKSFLLSIQRKDGSWYGSWACCFCYAGWFGIEGLVTCGEPVSSPSIQKACEFLLHHQRANGGWGEDFTSCYDKDYAENGMEAYGDEGSGVVNTAWALLALSAAKYDDIAAVKRGCQYLLQRQLPCGDWPQEGIAGVFNRACGITYTAYRNVFPIWALGRCRATYGSALDV